MIHLPRTFLAVLALLGATLALADPPARVGRLALVENGVDFRADRDDAGEPASINWPISNGAMLNTDRRGRAEVWVGSTAFRLGSSSQLAFPVVDDRQVALQLSDGTLAVSILERDQADDVTVDTPDGRIRFATAGRYRIDVLGDRSELSVQAGRASFDDGERSHPVAAGQRASFGRGGVRMEDDSRPDAFDRWVSQRENAALAREARRHVSPAMTGYQDLDAYGDWRTQPEYGAVWYPRAVAVDWAPYRFGRWVWLAPWGWTWIDQAPWGFAPFHYGRWVLLGGRWGWVPGTYIARPVYAPALVAWIGSPGWSVTFRTGAAPAVGWFPLAPREVYVPPFQATPTYVRQVNITTIPDTTVIDRAMRGGPPAHFTHRELPQAVTVVPAGHLREGRPIRAGEFRRPDRQLLAGAPSASVAPNPVLLPPAEQRPRRESRDERRDPPLRGREPEERGWQREGPRGEPGGRAATAGEWPRREAMPVAPAVRENEDRRGARREMSGGAAAGHSPEPIKSEPERRQAQPGRVLPADRPDQAPEGRRERAPRESSRELSPGLPPGRDAERHEREASRQVERGQRQRENAPVPSPMAPRAEPERRSLASPGPGPERDEHRPVERSPRHREMAPVPPPAPRAEPERRPPVQSMPPRPERDMSPPVERMQRQREMAPPPQAQPAPQQMRVPVPQMAPPAPPREPPRAEQRPPEPPRGGHREGGPERRHGRDERE